MRAEIPVPSLALVGYTNAGKSTLFRALTGADAYVADQLFATLDPTVRRITLPGGTRGRGRRHRRLHPRAARTSSWPPSSRPSPRRARRRCLLHVVDASDPRRDEHIAQVNAVLEEIGAERDSADPRLQQDRPPRERPAHRSRRRRARDSRCGSRRRSASGSICCADAIAERLARFARRARLSVPASAGALRSRLYAARAVRARSSGDDGSIELAVELPDVELLALARTAGVQILEVQEAGVPCAPADAYLQSTALSHAGKLR